MIHLLNLLAAIALLVWGTNIVRAGVIRIFGENLRRVLASSLSNRFKSVLAGLAPSGPLLLAARVLQGVGGAAIANGVVLVPTFNDPSDRRALGVLADVFPDRTIVGIHAVDLVWGLGTLHCLTQQMPAISENG